jgi:hypothetical protein
MSEGVLDGVELAPLPRHSRHGRLPCGLEACMVVADDELHAVHASCLKALEEVPPVRLGLASRHAAAEHGPLTVGCDTDGGQDRTGHNGPAMPDLFVSGVED